MGPGSRIPVAVRKDGIIMKEIILSADGYAVVYLVPDKAAENLGKYCMDFNRWMWRDPNGAKLLKDYGGRKIASYTEKDFIDYLNEWVFPDERSVLVKELGCFIDDVPKEYRKTPKFNF